jgi:hypothetical protein
MGAGWRVALLIGLLLAVTGCGELSGSAERVDEITVPVNPAAADAPRIEVSGRTEGRCGGEGGCVYFGKLNGPVSEGFGYEVGWEFHEDEEGRLSVPDDIEMPLAVPGKHVIQLYAQEASDVIVNDQRQLEAVVARCNGRFDVSEGATTVLIEVTFLFDAAGEGRCSIARLGSPMEPAITFEPTPSP